MKKPKVELENISIDDAIEKRNKRLSLRSKYGIIEYKIKCRKRKS